MDHNAIKEQLFAWYDGELDPDARQTVEAHLAVCQECREVSQRWTKTAQVFFKAQKPAVASEFFVRTVMNRIHELESPRPARNWRISLPWLVPAVGFAFLFFLAVFPSPQTISIDTLFFQETSGHLSWALSNNAPNTDETLQFVMGEQS